MEKKQIVTVDEYIAAQPAASREELQAIRAVIRSAAPEAEECISYGMPGYKQNGVLVWFAANKAHCGFYVPPRMLDKYRERLKEFVMTKSAVHFPYTHPIPFDLVSEITIEMVKFNQEALLLKRAKKI